MPFTCERHHIPCCAHSQPLCLIIQDQDSQIKNAGPPNNFPAHLLGGPNAFENFTYVLLQLAGDSNIITAVCDATDYT